MITSRNRLITVGLIVFLLLAVAEEWLHGPDQWLAAPMSGALVLVFGWLLNLPIKR